MSKPQTILDLSECIKLARELDILGDYEKALSLKESQKLAIHL